MNLHAKIDFHPTYYFQEFNVDFGQEYHQDPLFRIGEDNKCQKALYNRFGEYGLGSKNPKLQEISQGIQPLDFINGALGGKMCYSSEEHVWTPEKPLEHVESVSDLEKIEDIDWENNSVFNDACRQVDEMQAAFPELKVSYMQGVGFDGEQCNFVMHTPYTTAFRLLGDRIFEYMILEPELAEAIFDYLMRQYEGLWEAICMRMGWSFENKKHIHFGDCAATMLSPTLYQSCCLPYYQKLMEKYDSCTIHSCGASTHLLDLFKEVSNVEQIQLGAGTDLTKIRKSFPDATIRAYYSAPEILNSTPDDVKKKVENMTKVLESNFIINASSIDPKTPIENITTYLQSAQEINEANI